MVNLRTPGPTPLPPAVREALARDMVNHRGPEFAAILRDCQDGVQWAFQTRHDVVILTTSGTGGLESLVANTLSPGQRLLVASMGYFGERMGKIARAFGVDVVQIDFEPGQAVDPQVVADRLKADPSIETVFRHPQRDIHGRPESVARDRRRRPPGSPRSAAARRWHQLDRLGPRRTRSLGLRRRRRRIPERAG